MRYRRRRRTLPPPRPSAGELKLGKRTSDYPKHTLLGIANLDKPPTNLLVPSTGYAEPMLTRSLPNVLS